MRIDLLDVGTTRYGDCLLVREGGRSILIDGAHPGDTASIRAQLRALFNQAPPFAVDLLVVTHCHSDHIGCLPALVGAGDLTPHTALVADEKLGWGRDADGIGPGDALGLSPAQQALVAALQEEDYSDLPPAELEEFLAQDATLEQKYIDMLDVLTQQGTKVIRYGRAKASTLHSLEADFADFGLEILGPTTDHLLLCAKAITDGGDQIANAVAALDVAADADIGGLARIYRAFQRRMVDAAEDAQDGGDTGAPKNDQSIVLKVEAGGWRALLAGDMQFVAADVPDLTPLMTALRQKVVQAGPYDFIKLTHHTSDNGVDESLLDEWQPTRLFAHSGGTKDAHHPNPKRLELLKARKDQLTFARTDRNGLITVERNGQVKMTRSKGQFNDFTPNQVPDLPEEPAPVGTRALTSPGGPSATIVRGGSGEVVEVLTRVPNRPTRVTVTIQIGAGGTAVTRAEQSTEPEVRPFPGGRQSPRTSIGPDLADLKLGGGRDLGNLLVVTSHPRLRNNIGAAESDAVFRTLARASLAVLDLPSAVLTADEAAELVRPRLAAGQHKGVLILGGFDVVPAERLNVLDEAARQAVEVAGQEGEDADDFTIWSDEIYGDRDGDFLPELPVSRIPDGRLRDVVFGALQAPRFAPGPRFGVHNVHRPFAKTVFPEVPGGGGQLEVSEQFSPEDVPAGGAQGAVYYMLHGSARDATRFWGETQGGAAYEAVGVENVPADARGTVVFTGCCWGALAMSPPAARAKPETVLRPRGPEASVAVAYLRAGALAFVGCTGSHYSPLQPPYDYYGKPMHDGFWAALAEGLPPAEALFQAKREFARGMPHGRTDPFSQAVEVKILRQYTCLGLGW